MHQQISQFIIFNEFVLHPGLKQFVPVQHGTRVCIPWKHLHVVLQIGQNSIQILEFHFFVVCNDFVQFIVVESHLFHCYI